MRIKNPQQHQRTLGWIRRFEAALDQMPKTPPPDSDLNQAQWELGRSGPEAQLEDLREQVREYERLREGEAVTVDVTDVGELPGVLIQARIAAGLTQKQLAERLGIKEQQIQRYEATEYRSASMRRVSEVADALGIRLRGTVQLPSRDAA